MIFAFLWIFAVKLGVGGFSMGAATSLYSATCFARGKYENGRAYPITLRAILGLSGWLPGARFGFYDQQNKIATILVVLLKC